MDCSRFGVVVVGLVVAATLRPAACYSCKESERDASGNCSTKTVPPPPIRPNPPSAARATQFEIHGGAELTGARVSLDGQFAGPAPLVLTTTPGRHLVEVQKDN